MKTITRPEGMLQHRPPHPGRPLWELWLAPLGLTVGAAAKALGITRKTLSAILNAHAGISPEMAVRLSLALGTSAALWLNLQTAYDLWHAERRRARLRVTALHPSGPADTSSRTPRRGRRPGPAESRPASRRGRGDTAGAGSAAARSS